MREGKKVHDEPCPNPIPVPRQSAENSIPENEDDKYVTIFRIGALAGSAALILFNFGNVILAVYAFFFSVKYRSTHDDPEGSRSRKAMKRSEYKKWSLIYLSLFVGGLVFGSVFPNWIVF